MMIGCSVVSAGRTMETHDFSLGDSLGMSIEICKASISNESIRINGPRDDVDGEVFGYDVIF